MALRPEVVREISGEDEFGIVEKELTVFERLYNLKSLERAWLEEQLRQ
jgi:hypothetical protein